MVHPQPVVWHGTAEEAGALLAALAAHCTCNTQYGQRAVCPGHEAMLDNQRFLDHLLFLRRTQPSPDDNGTGTMPPA